MKKIFCVISLLILLNSCDNVKKNNFNIYRAIDKNYKSKSRDEQKINLLEITNFSWDYFYFFRHTATPEEIDSILGLKYEFYDEFSDKYFFVKNNKVIAYDGISLKFKGIDPKGGGSLVFFPIDYDKNYILINKKNCIFTVTKEINRFNEICYYLDNNQIKN